MWKYAVGIQIQWFQWQPPDLPSAISTSPLKLAGIHGTPEDRLHMKNSTFFFGSLFEWNALIKLNEMYLAGWWMDRGLWRANLCHSERSRAWSSIDPTGKSFDTFQIVPSRESSAKIMIYNLQRNRPTTTQQETGHLSRF